MHKAISSLKTRSEPRGFSHTKKALQIFRKAFVFNGRRAGIRTLDPLIKSQLL